MVVVATVESRLGFGLPPLLRELYTQVGNGGFGPGYGILGLEGGFADPLIFDLLDPALVGQTQGGTLIDWYFTYRGTDPAMPELDLDLISGKSSAMFVDPKPGPGTWDWFDKLVPIANLGCWQIVCIDCAKPAYPVLCYDGQQCQLRLSTPTFEAWIEGWLAKS